MTGEKAPNTLCITQNGDEKYLSELMKEKLILIFRYTQISNPSCYEEQIRLIQDIFKDIPHRVVILASYFEISDFLFSLRDRVLEIPIYYIPFDGFDWQAEGYNIPYFFVLHPCLRISNIFVPNKQKPELTIRYLESIKRLLQ